MHSRAMVRTNHETLVLPAAEAAKVAGDVEAIGPRVILSRAR